MAGGWETAACRGLNPASSTRAPSVTRPSPRPSGPGRCATAARSGPCAWMMRSPRRGAMPLRTVWGSAVAWTGGSGTPCSAVIVSRAGLYRYPTTGVSTGSGLRTARAAGASRAARPRPARSPVRSVSWRRAGPRPRIGGTCATVRRSTRSVPRRSGGGTAARAWCRRYGPRAVRAAATSGTPSATRFPAPNAPRPIWPLSGSSARGALPDVVRRDVV